MIEEAFGVVGTDAFAAFVSDAAHLWGSARIRRLALTDLSDGFAGLVVFDASALSRDSNAWQAVELALRRSRGSAILVGPASASESFEAARIGFSAYVEMRTELHAAIVRAVACSPTCRLERAAADVVAEVGLIEAQRLVRFRMLREALRRVEGNRHAAARLLRIDRRYVNKMIEEEPCVDPRQQKSALDSGVFERGKAVTADTPAPACAAATRTRSTG